MEFENVDISISWHEEPILRSNVTITGDEKVISVFFKNGRYHSSQDIVTLEEPVKFIVATGNDAKYPELFHYAVSKGAKFTVVFEKAGGMGGLLAAKYRGWAHSQESGIVVFEIIDVAGRLHYGVYAPLDKTEKGDGIIVEGNSPLIVEVEI